MEELTAEALAQRFAQLDCEAPLLSAGSERVASVLIPLLTAEPCCPVVFTRRADRMRRHAGEISLPGGLLEPADDGSVISAALREAQEELGLPPAAVQVQLVLPHCRNSHGLVIYPVVGIVTRPLQWLLQAEEVAEVIEVPLGHFLRAEHYRLERRTYDGEEKQSLVLDCGVEQIWGLTARIMNNLRLLLNPKD